MAYAMMDFQKFSQYQSRNSSKDQEKDMQTLLSTFSGEIESQQDQDLFQDDNNVLKNKK